MIETPIVKRYVEALFAVAKKNNKVDLIFDDLNLISDTYNKNFNFEKVLSTPVIALETKKNILFDLFFDKVDRFTFNFLCLIIDKRREKIIGAVASEYEKLMFEDKNMVSAVVESVIPLGDAELEIIRRSLEANTDKYVLISKNVINKSIIGGVRVTLGDNVFDGSISARIRDLKEILVNS